MGRKHRSLSISLISLVFFAFPAAITKADDRTSTCFRVDERGPQFIESSPLVLCVTASDLKRYPKSVVTFTLTKYPDDGGKPELLATRHYKQIRDGEFGRRVSRTKRRAYVTFDTSERTVELAFVSKEFKSKYHYRPIELQQGQLRRQKLELGKLETRKPG